MAIKAICLNSAGLDSTTIMAYAHNKNYDIYSMFMNYSQRTLEKERECSKKISDFYKVKEYKEVDLTCLSDIGGSSLFKKDATELLTDDNKLKQYVPFRNSIFISIAVAWAEAIKADIILVGATLGPWVSPDNSPEYFVAVNNLVHIGSMQKNKINVEAPMNYMSKKEVVELGLSLKAPYENSWSCHNYMDKACGICSNCQDRLKGFSEANAVDPIPYV